MLDEFGVCGGETEGFDGESYGEGPQTPWGSDNTYYHGDGYGCGFYIEHQEYHNSLSDAEVEHA